MTRSRPSENDEMRNVNGTKKETIEAPDTRPAHL
jgi:hypothetical protein